MAAAVKACIGYYGISLSFRRSCASFPWDEGGQQYAKGRGREGGVECEALILSEFHAIKQQGSKTCATVVVTLGRFQRCSGSWYCLPSRFDSEEGKNHLARPAWQAAGWSWQTAEGAWHQKSEYQASGWACDCLFRDLELRQSRRFDGALAERARL